MLANRYYWYGGEPGGTPLPVPAAGPAPKFASIARSGILTMTAARTGVLSASGGRPSKISCLITAPVNNATVSGMLTIAVTATSSARSISHVDYYIDGILRYTDSSSPFSVGADTTTWSNGSHTIQAIAHDGKGNVGGSRRFAVTASNTVPVPADLERHYVNSSFVASAYEPPTGCPSTSGSPSDETLLATHYDLALYLDSAYVRGSLGFPGAPAMYQYSIISQPIAQTWIDWLNWADANSVNREDAFFHAKNRAYNLFEINHGPGRH